MLDNIPMSKFAIRKYLYSLCMNGLAHKNINIQIADCTNINFETVVINVVCFSLFSLQSSKYLNIPCSICKVAIGSSRLVNVFNKSTTPYSSLLKTAVYTGSKKNVINCVHILPMDTIAVFFAKSLPLLILTPSQLYI